MKKKAMRETIDDLAEQLNRAHQEAHDLEVALGILTVVTAGLLSCIESTVKLIEAGGSPSDVVMQIDEDHRAALSAFENLIGKYGSDDEEDCGACPLKNACPVYQEDHKSDPR